MSGIPVSIDELMDVFSYSYSNRSKFKANYLKPLVMVGFMKMTNPDKPTASNQKYVITEAGKMFLTGRTL
jgi:ATP-dependent DNA helicase RecG